MKLCFIKDRILYKCMNTNCKRYLTARHKLFNLNKASNISIEKILEIIWYWSSNHSVKFTAKQTSLNTRTIIQWFKKIRKVLLGELHQAKPMGGKGYHIQIDESLFRGKRK